MRLSISPNLCILGSRGSLSPFNKRSIALLSVVFAAALQGQTVSSTVSATIVDRSGGVLPDAQCELINPATSAVLRTRAATEGSCTFTGVLPGTYRFTASLPGFKSQEITNVVVTSSERRALGLISLQVGEVQETVSVTAETTPLQTESSERSGLVTGNQLQDIALRGRDFFAMMTTIPGVVDDGSIRRETTSPNSVQGTFINGMRDNQKNFTTDGISSMDSGSNFTVHFQPNMDSIAEVRVLTSNYQAEFGRNAGGVVTVITKSGSRDFHATGYYQYRHENLNANSFFNNRSGTPKQPYRYRINGYTIGGPIFVPKVFNRNRDKLFFFWSQEFTGVRRDYGTRFANTPTERERAGDFSQSFDQAGNLLVIRDPLTGKSFPGNVIPSDRMNQFGQSILNFFPLPNYTDPDPRLRYSRNYRATYSGTYPRRQDMIRVDYNVTDTLRAFYRFMQDKDEQDIPWGSWTTGSINFLASPVVFGQPGHGHVVQLTKTFSPTLVNETIFGKSYNRVYFNPIDPSAFDRSRMGDPPQWFPDPAIKTSFIPNVTFGSIPTGPVNATLGNIPYLNYNDIWSLVNNTNKIFGSHTVKAGFYFERTRKFAPNFGAYRGSFNFGRDPNNPFDTNHGFANALLGQYTSYTEATLRADVNMWFTNLEWYVQDNWRINKRLTLDAGIRFYYLPMTYDDNKTFTTFVPGYYDPAQAPALYWPARSGGGQLVARDPRTGAFAPSVLIGRYVPNSGDTANGMAIAGTRDIPSGIMHSPGIKFGPRIGFAYDLFGNGRTALRGGFGLFYDRPQGQPWVETAGQPPVAYSPTQFYGSLSDFSQGGGLGPSNLNILLGEGKVPTTMNYSFGLQHQVWNTVVDISYVGSQSRNLLTNRNINPIPLYARFDPANQNPASPGVPLQDNFLRPYQGYGNIILREFSTSSNYNSLQVSANRRFARGFQFGVAYTWSKALGMGASDYDTLSPYFSPRQRNYGLLPFDRTHSLVINYIYELPKVASIIGFRPLHWVTDNWQVSGITSFVSGAPVTPTFTTTDNADLTGSSEAARIDVIGNPTLDKGDRTFFQNFRTDAFARPAHGSFGNAGVGILRGPGTSNWDIAISKRFPLPGEGRFIQFRTELFNAFNHTQFLTYYTNALFNTAGKQIDPNFGAFASARDPRIIQLSLRVAF